MVSVLTLGDLETVTFAIEPAIEEAMIRRREIVASTSPASAQVCKYFQKGTCMKGEACAFRHTRGEKSVVCKHWLRGLCKKADLCEFLHEYDLTKMPPCHFFVNFGKCANPECVFLHVKPEDRIKDCAWYARGFCRHGPNCRNRHVRQVACGLYLAGFCPNGKQCKFGHPKFELPPDEDDNTALDAEPQVQVRGPGPVIIPSKPQARHPNIICHRCGMPGHMASHCTNIAGPTPGSKDMKRLPGGGSLRPLDQVQCFKCGEIGHYANVCTNPRRQPQVDGTFRSAAPVGAPPNRPPPTSGNRAGAAAGGGGMVQLNAPRAPQQGGTAGGGGGRGWNWNNDNGPSSGPGEFS